MTSQVDRVEPLSNSRASTPSLKGAPIQDDGDQLAALGHTQELKRNFSFISLLGLAFAILNTWTALSASLSIALPSGGPVAVIWGLVASGICNLCLAASLAEFLSAYPISAGQYYWAAVVSPPDWMCLISWITGWINTAGWISLSATGGLLTSQFVLSIVIFLDESFSPQPWQQFLLYIFFTLLTFVVNAFMTHILPVMTKAAFIWSILGFTVVSITVIACAAPDYQPASEVYGGFVNTTGWPDGIAWLLGLLQGAFSLTGFDAVAHMVEEIPQPSKRAPKIIIMCVGIGFVTGFIFLSVLLFSLKDLDRVVSSPSGPLLQIFFDATGSKAGSVCLLFFPFGCLLFGAISIVATSSRMTYAFARDGGLPFSPFFAKVHPTLGLPLNALYLTIGLVIIFGCVLLGSASAINAITGASVVALGITYTIPLAINCARGRKALPESRPFKLPGVLGWIMNLVGIITTSLTTVLFLFPPFVPVTVSNMNYCVIAFGFIIVVSTIHWFVDGRKNFKGPLSNSSVIDAIQIESSNVNGQKRDVGTVVEADRMDTSNIES
ncbi:gaba permease [Mariannaea sp. PMI_226]|nr:gaba permease [Mariannaea sp. PMI_226]